MCQRILILFFVIIGPLGCGGGGSSDPFSDPGSDPGTANAEAPNLSDRQTTTFTVNEATAALPFINNGGGDLTQCSSLPELPDGLAVRVSSELSTCEIHGAPTATQAETSYTIRATNDAGSSDANITIIIIDDSSLEAPTLSSPSLQTYVVNESIVVLSFVNNGGGDLTQCSSLPELPDGLAVSLSTDLSTCEIHGTPTAIQAETSYTIRATNDAGSSDANITIIITDDSLLEAPNLSNPSLQTYFVNESIGVLSFVNNGGGDLTQCSSLPELPDGLAVRVSSELSTCEIYGTPTALQSETTHTITALNDAGSSEASISIVITNASDNTYPSYPDLDLSALPIEAPQPPLLPGNFDREVNVSTLSDLRSEFAQGDVRITLDQSIQGTANLVGHNVELILPSGVCVNEISLSTTHPSHAASSRVRVLGPGCVGIISAPSNQVAVEDITIEGLTINNGIIPRNNRQSSHNTNIVLTSSSRVAIISNVIYNAGVDSPSANHSFVGNNFLLSHSSDVVIADNNMGITQATDGDNWCFRLATGARVVLIDNYCYAGGNRATVREGGQVSDMIVMSSPNAIDSDRQTTLINMNIPNIHQETTNPDTDQVYHQNTRVWFDDLSEGVDTSGGPFPFILEGSGNDTSRFFSVSNVEFHYRDDAMPALFNPASGINGLRDVLLNRESRAGAGEVWEYNIDTHSYIHHNTRAALLDSIPEPPRIYSRQLERFLPESDPFSLNN